MQMLVFYVYYNFYNCEWTKTKSCELQVKMNQLGIVFE